MSRATSRNLFLIALAVWVFLTVITYLALRVVHVVPFLNFAHSSEYISVAVGGVVAELLWLIAFIGALVKLARLSQWLWFVLLLLFAPLIMLIYIFAGPTTPATSA